MTCESLATFELVNEETRFFWVEYEGKYEGIRLRLVGMKSGHHPVGRGWKAELMIPASRYASRKLKKSGVTGWGRSRCAAIVEAIDNARTVGVTFPRGWFTEMMCAMEAYEDEKARQAAEEERAEAEYNAWLDEEEFTSGDWEDDV